MPVVTTKQQVVQVWDALLFADVGKVGSGNAYVYGDDAPVMMTDPSGKASFGCNFAVALNFFAIGVSISGIIGTLTLGVPIAVLGLDAALGVIALTVAVFSITVLAAAAILFAVYEIVQSISTVRNACSS